MKHNLLITGATGFIGTHLLKVLAKTNNHLHLLVRPDSSSVKSYANNEKIKIFTYQNSYPQLEAYLKTEKISGVVHLASLYLKEHQSQQISELIESNVTLGCQLLEASTHSHVKWFLNTGTFWQHFENQAYNPVNLYAATKQAFIDIAKFYYESSDLIFTTIMLGDTYGPGDTRPKILNLWNNISKSGEILRMSAGEQILNLNYIEDIVTAYLQLIQLAQKSLLISGSEYSIKAKKLYSLKELATIFEAVTHRKLNIEWGKVDYKTREVFQPWDKGVLIPGWEPKTDIEDGIRKTFG